ncbi:hypothetical protein [Dyadobacter sp. CY312]|uniref:hypothetical protein n=1 Tax=Dyadobacter sp. CY312 TaxID=2907303 RepID=UPI001F1EB3AB|nr:hypothetical protein [Dyadobacter sp. CY312]MCE7041086.1 hypothetical protein [Dyadobacter sp. CY312]
MRHLAILLISFITFNSIGQITPKWLDNSKPQATLHDSIPKVIYTNEHKHGGDAAFFINGEFISGGIVPLFNPEIIKDVNVYRDSITVGETLYDSQIRITTKNNYLPKFISLNQLKAKYTSLAQQHAVFSINNDRIINKDYDKYLVDESYILSITIEKTDKAKGSSDLNFIRLLTRTPENIAKSKQIRIRGANLASSF